MKQSAKLWKKRAKYTFDYSYHGKVWPCASITCDNKLITYANLICVHSPGFLKASSWCSAVTSVSCSQYGYATCLGIGCFIRADPSTDNKILCLLFSLIKYPPWRDSRWNFLLVWGQSIWHQKPQRKGIVQTGRMAWESVALLQLRAPARVVWLLGLCQRVRSTASWGGAESGSSPHDLAVCSMPVCRLLILWPERDVRIATFGVPQPVYIFPEATFPKSSNSWLAGKR